jgi:hypothetical protein
VVGGQHGRRGHDHRHQPAERANQDGPAGGHDGHAEHQVPADVQARHRGVLVDEGGRLQDAVGPGLLGDGVDVTGLEKARGSHRVGGVDAQPHGPEAIMALRIRRKIVRWDSASQSRVTAMAGQCPQM